eukprot:1279834-Amphidinium_carterae.1
MWYNLCAYSNAAKWNPCVRPKHKAQRKNFQLECFQTSADAVSGMHRTRGQLKGLSFGDEKFVEKSTSQNDPMPHFNCASGIRKPFSQASLSDSQMQQYGLSSQARIPIVWHTYTSLGQEREDSISPKSTTKFSACAIVS